LICSVDTFVVVGGQHWFRVRHDPG